MSEAAPGDSIRQFFFDAWALYDFVLDHDYMAHNALYREAGRAVAAWAHGRAFSMLDLGCGSGRHLAPALRGQQVSRYEGHDLSGTAIAHARKNLATLGCPLHFLEGDLRAALRAGRETFDLIFSGFALHHLTTAERDELLRRARRQLTPGGLLLCVDSVRDADASREQWLERYCGWIEREWRMVPREGMTAILEHIRGYDQPGSWPEHVAGAQAAGFARCWELHRDRWHALWACE
jgi:SAM-dependent methyltransferase